MASNLVTPTGTRITYHFVNGERLHLFGVTSNDISGLWYRVTDHTGTLYVIDPKKVLWLKTNEIS
jgi:hypothetical protein